MSESASSSGKSLFKSKVQLECVNLFDYLKTQQQEVLERLFYEPSITLAVFRELPEIAKQFVIRMLFVEQPVPQAVVQSWGSQVHAKWVVLISVIDFLMRLGKIQKRIAGWKLSSGLLISLTSCLSY